MRTADSPPVGTVERDAAFTLPPRLMLWGLVVKYALLVGYGVSAVVAGIPTFRLVAGPLLELLWPSAIAILASLALAGVARSWSSVATGFELHTTQALVAVFTAYSAALVFRALTQGDTATAALAFLPMILLVFPALRVLSITIWRKGGHR